MRQSASLLPAFRRYTTLQAVRDAFIWTVGNFILNIFSSQGRDLSTYMAPDRINALVVTDALPGGSASPAGSPAHDAVLGCQDRYVRVIRGSSCIAELGLEGPVTALAVVPPAATGGVGAPRHVVYGTATGAVGLLLLAGGRVTAAWSVAPPSASGVAPAAVNCMEVSGGARGARSSEGAPHSRTRTLTRRSVT